MKNTIIFTITKYYNKDNLPVIDIKTKHKDFKRYNLERVCVLRGFEKMEGITTKVNAENYAVLFEVE